MNRVHALRNSVRWAHVSFIGVPCGGIRKRPVHRFPYAVLYRVDPDEIVVVAVMHQRRRPDYWRSRIGSSIKSMESDR